MAITEVPQSGKWGDIADLLNLNFTDVHNSGSSDHIHSPVVPLALTNTWQVVAGDWVENITPEGTVLNVPTGSFELSKLGRWNPTIERIYHNHDTNPATPVVVYIKVQTSTDEITWTDTDFTRSSLMSAATANDEPAIQEFNTAFLIDVVSVPVYFRILVKGDEGGANPEEAELVLMKVTSKIISNVPA